MSSSEEPDIGISMEWGAEGTSRRRVVL